MSTEIAPIKNITRRVKMLALQKAQDVLENPDNYTKEVYDQTYLTVLKNSVPRTQEITGEDGNPILIKQITGMEIIDDRGNIKKDSVSDEES